MQSYSTEVEKQQDISIIQLQEQLEQQKVLNNASRRIRKPIDLNTTLQTTVTQVRQLLNADRVVVFQFNSDKIWEGEFLCEDVASGWSPITSQKLYDRHLGEQFALYYFEVKIQATRDIYAAGLSNSHIEILSRFQVRADLVVPLLKDKKTWGLLCIHQCSSTREWKNSEIEFAKRVADNLTLAIEQTEYIKQLELQSIKLVQVTQHQQVISQIVEKIHQSLDLELVLSTTTQEVRKVLQADRVAIFRFNSDWSGNFVAESFDEYWMPLVGGSQVINDTFLQESKGGRYANNQTFTVDNIYQAGLDDCHIGLLEQFQAQAFITAPILQEDKLWGIIGAYQNTSPRSWEANEVDLLAQIGSQLAVALNHHELLTKAQYQTEQQKALTTVITRIRESLKLETIFSTTVVEVRQLLQADRVGIFRFDPKNNWEGEIIYEDVALGFTSAIKQKVHDRCFSENFAPLYRQGRVNAIADIYEHDFKTCYIKILEQFQIRANIVAPLLKEDELWGLMCIHQCSGSRDWKDSEIEFVYQIAEQLGVALKQDSYFKQVQSQAVELAKVKERNKAMERQKLLAITVDKIRQSLDIETIFKAATQAVRNLLKVERVAIYRFDANWRGKFVADSFQDGWEPPSNSQPLMMPTFLDLDNENLPRNEIFVPISQGDKLWGLLVANQTSQPRIWKNEEVDLLAQVGVQLGIAIQQGELLKRTQNQAAQLTDALQEIKQTQDYLIQGEKMASLWELFAGIAHEINNPINFILTNLTQMRKYAQHLTEMVNNYHESSADNLLPDKLLSDRLLPNTLLNVQEKLEEFDWKFITEDLPKMLYSMEIGAKRINQIVLSMRNFYRTDETELKTVNIHEGLDNTLLILGHRLKKNERHPGIKIIKIYGKLPSIECYPAQLNLVFMNLLANNIDTLEQKYISLKQKKLQPGTESPLSICIVTQVIDDKIQIKITDNGLGMPEFVRQRIFEPFFTTKETGQATGLGLSISHQIIVEKHKGQIKCFSKLGQGTEFLIEIPIKHIY